jgi:hypothetical protein
MNREMVETWRYLRDHGKPYTQQDAADYAKIRDFTPPSKAHVKLHRRAQLGMPTHPVPEPREYAPKSEEVLKSERQRAFYRKVIGQLGGSITIPPAPDFRPPIGRILPEGPIQHKSEREQLIENGRRLARESIRESCKMLYSDYQPDMFEVLEAWGSIEAWRKERQS